MDTREKAPLAASVEVGADGTTLVDPDTLGLAAVDSVGPREAVLVLPCEELPGKDKLEDA